MTLYLYLQWVVRLGNNDTEQEYDDGRLIKEAQISVVDTTDRHVYQPGWLYLPFGEENPKHLVKSERRFLRSDIDLRIGQAEHIDTAARTIQLTEGDIIPFDTLVLGTGAVLAPETVPGFNEGAQHLYSIARRPRCASRSAWSSSRAASWWSG